MKITLEAIGFKLTIEAPDGAIQISEAKSSVQQAAARDAARVRDEPVLAAPPAKSEPRKKRGQTGCPYSVKEKNKYQKWNRLYKMLGRAPTKAEEKTDYRGKTKKQSKQKEDEEILCQECLDPITNPDAIRYDEKNRPYHEVCLKEKD